MQRFRQVSTLVLIGALVCASLLTTSIAGVSAQDSEFVDLGLPEIHVNVSGTGFGGIPDEVEAGRYLVTVMAGEDTEFGGSVGFVKPEGMTAQEFLQAAAGPPDIVGADATPGMEADGTPPGGEGEEMGGGPPEIFYQFAFAGGVGALSGQTAQVVLDLTPGEWVAWGDDPMAPQEPVIFTVTGEMPADLTEPESSATITMAEYSIEVTEGELTAGRQVVKITNVGAQPHFIFAGRGPDTVTEEDLDAVIESEMTGTPASVDFNPDEDLIPVFLTGTQSTNTDIWISVDLEPGKYVMICFFPDIASGMPHAFEGMYNLIEVSE